MKRILFVLTFCIAHTTFAQNRTAELRQELVDAFEMSEKYTLTICEQMPAEHYTYKTVDSVMTFTEQFRHCVVYTLNQIAGRTGVKNPNEGRKLPVQGLLAPTALLMACSCSPKIHCYYFQF